ncbi:MAG: C40 family peptidase [Acidobacteria bacterium]|nr:C40 family peptidase [Acidobacteriota bacterium]MBK9705509.1 C40 family peptidase [Acidobacteriota bacterium]
MRRAYRPAFHMLTLILLVTIGSIFANGQALSGSGYRFSAQANDFNMTSSPEMEFVPVSRTSNSSRKIYLNSMLYGAIQDRIGIPYRANGTDDRGYDCSGFVWRVYQEAGIDLKRNSAKSLWEKLPEAAENEETQFGTLVFFEGLGHVGIVRDGFSFYHASSSQGVIRSFYSDYSNYWGKRIIGYRRVPLTARKIRPRY